MPPSTAEPSRLPAKKSEPWTNRIPRKFDSLTVQEYIDERLNPMRAWYDQQSIQCKRNYLAMRATTVIGGAIVPVLINFQPVEVWQLASTLISLMVVIVLSLESVLHYREQWKSYRSTEQAMEKEYYNFTAAQGAYASLGEREAFRRFVEQVEGAIATEASATLNVMTTTNEQARPQPPAAPPPRVPAAPEPDEGAQTDPAKLKPT